MTTADTCEVIEADRQAAAANLSGPMVQCIRDGGLDGYPLVLDFARHRQAHTPDDAVERIAHLSAALQAIIDGDVPRPVGETYRSDKKPSKHDQCVHSQYMWEDCAGCIEDFAIAAIAAMRSHA